MTAWKESDQIGYSGLLASEGKKNEFFKKSRKKCFGSKFEIIIKNGVQNCFWYLSAISPNLEFIKIKRKHFSKIYLITQFPLFSQYEKRLWLFLSVKNDESILVFPTSEAPTMQKSRNPLKSQKILFSIFVSVSFCMFPCSKGHLVRA